jgi:hypothetical protein
MHQQEHYNALTKTIIININKQKENKQSTYSEIYACDVIGNI